MGAISVYTKEDAKVPKTKALAKAPGPHSSGKTSAKIASFVLSYLTSMSCIFYILYIIHRMFYTLMLHIIMDYVHYIRKSLQ